MDKTITEIKEEGVREFIEEFEKSHFRTVHDTGANYQTMFLWNMVRSRAGMPRLKYTDLPAYCIECKEYHVRPHSRTPSKFDSPQVVEAFRRAGIYD